MKRLCVLLFPILLAGCANDTDPEDKHFFNRGWVNPRRDIDQDPAFDGPPPRSDKMPGQVHPEHYKEDPILS